MSSQQEMSETLNKINTVFSKMEILYDTSRERQEMWERLIQEQRESDKERILLIEKRWGGLMKIVIVLAGIFLASFIRDTVAIGVRPTGEEIKQMIDKRDYATKSDVMRGVESIVDDTYNTFERETEMTHKEASLESEDIKLNANRKITNYNPRSIK